MSILVYTKKTTEKAENSLDFNVGCLKYTIKQDGF